MTADGLGTCAAALALVVIATAIGLGVLAASGRREPSWIAPAIGLAAAAIIAWWAVRLPGEGATALAVLAAAAVLGAGLAASRMTGLGAWLREGLPALIAVAVAVAIPFAAEGHFGILGTGFNVDMSQHLYVADWLADPRAAPPSLFRQGYPLGPHALAVALEPLSGGLVNAFTGLTIALPVIAALAARTATGRLSGARAAGAAALAGIPYLTASYLAQGSFKELFEATLLLGFCLALLELHRSGRERGEGERGGLRGPAWRAAIPLGVIAAGTLYVYSAPGLLWIAGGLGVWGVAELAAGDATRRRALLGATLPALGAGLVAMLILAAPEGERIAEFGVSAGNVATAPGRAAAGPGGGTAALYAEAGATDAWSPAADGAPSDRGAAEPIAAATDGGEPQGRPEGYDNSLGNLFGQVNPLTAFGIWPSGDFRLQPGSGSVPALAFYLGALLGLLALAAGIAAARREREHALLAFLAAAALIWLGARVAGTPYTAAKALQMLAPLVMLLAARAALAADLRPAAPRKGTGGGAGRAWPARLAASLGAAFALAAAGSSALALANAPVGPGTYTSGVAKARPLVAGQPVLTLVPAPQLETRHGRAYYAWELRGASRLCLAPLPEGGEVAAPAPDGFPWVITVSRRRLAPFENLERVLHRRGVSLWRVQGPAADLPAPAPGSEEPTACRLRTSGS